MKALGLVARPPYLVELATCTSGWRLGAELDMMYLYAAYVDLCVIGLDCSIQCEIYL